MRAERINEIDYSARLKPPYTWKVFAITENNKKITIEEGQGSWGTALFAAQDWRNLIFIREFLTIPQKDPRLSSAILKVGLSMFENDKA